MKMTILNPKLREPKLNDYLVIGEEDSLEQSSFVLVSVKHLLQTASKTQTKSKVQTADYLTIIP